MQPRIGGSSGPRGSLALTMATAPNSIEFRGDEIGDWTEVKLDIIKKYAVAYSKILAAQPHLHHD